MLQLQAVDRIGDDFQADFAQLAVVFIDDDLQVVDESRRKLPG